MSWNMNHRAAAWGRLGALVARHGVSVALLQEAKRPAPASLPPAWRTHPPADAEERWRIAVPRVYRSATGELKPTRRWFASAVVAIGHHPITPREPTELHEVVDGDLACSHPG